MLVWCIPCESRTPPGFLFKKPRNLVIAGFFYAQEFPRTLKTKNQSRSAKNNIDHQSEWLEKEPSECEFTDKRLKKRFDLVCKQLWNGIGQPIPFACRDWENTKAAYRFFLNDSVNETQVLSGHFESTKERFSREKNYILVLQDTTEFSYQGINANKIGSTHVILNGKDRESDIYELFCVAQKNGNTFSCKNMR